MARPWPPVQVTISDDGHSRITIAGLDRNLTSPSVPQARADTLQLLGHYSKWLHRRLVATCIDPAGTWNINVDESGRASEASMTKRSRWKFWQ